MDRRPHIKWQSYDQLLKIVALNQAKGSAGEQLNIAEMQLEDPSMPELSKIQEMVTYDIVPELESYLHSIGKRLHSSLDEQEKIAKTKLNRVNRGEDSENENENEEEEKKDEEEQKEDDQNEEAKSDIAERVEQIYKDRELAERELDEATELKQKYKTGIQVYDGFIQKLIEQIGRGYLIGTVSAYQQDQTERQQIETEHALAEQKTTVAEFQNKFTNQEMVQTCAKIKQIMTDQISELGETKAQLHTKMLAYVKDEMEMRKIAL